MNLRYLLRASILFFSLLGACAPQPTYCWKPDRQPAGEHKPTLVPFRDHELALKFSAERETYIDLDADGEDSFDIDGPFAVEAVIQLDQIPSGRRAVVSKWRLADKGRSYEVGVLANRRVFFTVSADGRWSDRARELVGYRLLEVHKPYHVVAVYEPGQRMALYINGWPAGEALHNVPDEVYEAKTPLRLGDRFGSTDSAFDGMIRQVCFFNKSLSARQVALRAGQVGLSEEPDMPAMAVVPRLTKPYDLDRFKVVVRQWYTDLQAPGEPYGAYRLTSEKPADMYASADIAWSRWAMNDLELTAQQRAEWIDFIQDQQNPDGSFNHITGHCPTHAFCHALGGLNALGGKLRYAPALLDPYRNIDNIPQWLNGIDWVHQWGASHDIWGAGVPLACTPSTPQAWRDALFAWLDAEVDPETGFWRKGVESTRPMEYVGGAFHIWPIYAGRGRMIPFPEKVVDHILKNQYENGAYEQSLAYGMMDCAWAMAYVMDHLPHRRAEIRRSLERNLDALMRFYHESPYQFFCDAHTTESRIMTLAITYSAMPELFECGKPWRNPWHECALFEIEVE